MPNANHLPKKPNIFGESRGMSDEEADYVKEMIQEAQQSSRQLTIPTGDLDAGATTRLNRAKGLAHPILGSFTGDVCAARDGTGAVVLR